MAAYTSVLVLLALCMASAYSLKCYTCVGETSEDNCLTTATCFANQTTCMAVVVDFGNFSSITKDCASSCTPNTFNLGVSGGVFCCNTDLCNASGAPSMQAMLIILAVALFLGHR
ncbi:ly6/PLAUR domain-containing protein 2-like [Pyxicephalus adspersus]|uniref:ly6/PLAUR domain-containing protein 2-like n=1 Tax=Pyxicephalus adspersus TaxID=30357 RepID=UPI003B5BA602